MSLIEKNLSDHGITLPEPVAPVANYVPFVVTGNLVMISGQVSIGPDGLITGKVGDDLSLEDGVKAAEACAINLLAQLKAACEGDLDRAVRCVRLGGFVNCGPEFTDHPKVINGASDLMVNAMGSAGKHARAAVGASSLPLGAAVEVDGIFEIA
ncbi:MAG: RidA family protein [Aquisalinus sp.]|nr:RidA family protein [Aquisalinus sp.]